MPRSRHALVLAALLVAAIGSRPLPAQELLTYRFSFTARAFVFGELTTTDFTWAATRPVAETFCQSPNSITTCWQSVTNSTMTIGGHGAFAVSDLFRLRSKSYANQGVGGVGIEWDGGSTTLFEIWNDQLLAHNLGGPLSSLAPAGACGGNGGYSTVDCVWHGSGLPFWTISTSGGEVRLADILSASYSAAVVQGETDPETGGLLPPVDPDPDGPVPPGFDCRVTPTSCIPETNEPGTVVPEPTSLALLTAGGSLLAVVGWRRRREQRAPRR